jgi:hypothetical protein
LGRIIRLCGIVIWKYELNDLSDMNLLLLLEKKKKSSPSCFLLCLADSSELPEYKMMNKWIKFQKFATIIISNCQNIQ